MTRRRLAGVIVLASALLGTIGPDGTARGQSPGAAPAAFDVVDVSIEQLQQAMREGRVTSRQLVDAYLARIAAYDQQGPALNAIAAINPEARAVADALDAERAARGPRGPLHGIPVLIKDNYETIEMPTTAGSIALAGFHPRRDAVLVARLKTAGAIVLAKTTMHELAAGILTVGSSFGQTRNPYDLDRTPGGSSGGTGAGVAASFAAAGMGSDTCGSIRIPSANNNLVGLRGTQGLASRTGIVPLSSTQDIGGPLSRGIADLAIMLDATVGPDPRDTSTATTAGRIPPSYRAMLDAEALKGARLGVVRALFGTAAEDDEVRGVVQRRLDALKAAGADIRDIVIPGLDDLLRDGSMINADFKADLAAYLAAADDPPVRSLGEILDRGLYHSALEATFRARNAVADRESDEARRARIKRVALRQVVESTLAEHRLTALIYPTLRRKAARIGDPQPGTNCQLSAHSGLPALAVPAGFTEDGVPVGIDLLGSAYSESTLLSLGYAMERHLPLRAAPFSTPALVDGRAPAPRPARVTLAIPGTGGSSGLAVTIAAQFDITTSLLRYAVTPEGDAADRVASIWLHAGTPSRPGAARHRLTGTSGAASGDILLSAADRRQLAASGLLVRLHLRDARAVDGMLRLEEDSAGRR